MPYNPQFDHRRSIRLRGFDYSQPGSYFVTVVTYQRECLFGQIENDEIYLNLPGQCVEMLLSRLPHLFPVTMNYWVVMPNHVHFLFTIEPGSRKQQTGKSIQDTSITGTSSRSVGAIVQNFKSTSSRHLHQISRLNNRQIWQRNFYEHIVRDQDDFNRIAEYIEMNPLNWDKDELHKD